MKVKLNGASTELPEGATVSDAVDLVAAGASQAKGIAVAVNGEVVARSRWDGVILGDDDRVEVLRAVGGG